MARARRRRSRGTPWFTAWKKPHSLHAAAVEDVDDEERSTTGMEMEVAEWVGRSWAGLM